MRRAPARHPPVSRGRWLAELLAVCVVSLVGCAADRPPGADDPMLHVSPLATPSAEEGVGVGHRPPAFSVRDLDGRLHTLESYAGEILVLHFWATWCPYCRGEIPKLRQIHETFRDQGVRIIAVSVDQDLGTLQSFIEEQALPYPVVHEEPSPSSLATRYAVGGIPDTVVIDRDGRIASRLRGSADIVAAVEWLNSIFPAEPSA